MTEPTLQQYAALACALGIARATLYAILWNDDDFSLEAIESTIRGTSLANIAAVIGQSEDEMWIDWNDYLTTEQQRMLG